MNEDGDTSMSKKSSIGLAAFVVDHLVLSVEPLSANCATILPINRLNL